MLTRNLNDFLVRRRSRMMSNYCGVGGAGNWKRRLGSVESESYHQLPVFVSVGELRHFQ